LREATHIDDHGIIQVIISLYPSFFIMSLFRDS
jgi:hypothetical protein